DHLRTHSYKHVPAVNIYYHILLSQLEPAEEKHFAKLKELITSHYKLFSLAELKNQFVFAMNYCIGKINQGKTGYLKEIFALYQYALENDLMLEEDFLSPWDYKNIITVSLRLKEFKWTEKFIRDYKNRIEKK